MKFNYPEMQTVPHNGWRWYETPTGKFYPSITTVLGATATQEKLDSLQAWRESMGFAEADAYTQARADHGTMVHLLCERYLKKEQVDAPVNGAPISAQDMGAFKALRLKLNKVNEVWGQEIALASDTLECAGRCDLVGIYKGVPCIVDFKTSGRIKNDDDIHDYKIQLGFYATAHNETYGTDLTEGVVLMVAKNGFPLEFHVHLPDHTEELERRISLFWDKALATV